MFDERPLFIPFLSLAAGLAAADIFNLDVSLLSLVGLLSCLLLACTIKNRTPFLILTFILFFALGMYALSSSKRDLRAPEGIQTFAGKNRVTVEGVVVARPVETTDGSNLILEVDGVVKDNVIFKTRGKLQVFIATGKVSVARGDRIRFNSRIVVPYILGLPGEFDYMRYLVFRGISATARIHTSDDLMLIKGGERQSLLRTIDMHAVYLGERIRLAVPQPERSSVLTALLLGDQKQIPENLSRAYTRAGVNHILSISGFHVGIIVFFIAQLAFVAASRSGYLLLEYKLRCTILLLALPAMIMYLLLTGTAPATARSVIMLAAFVLASYVERETDPINTMLLAAMLLVALDPPTLFDLSFQLSFLALWGIIVIVPKFMHFFEGMEKPWLYKLLQFLSISAAASLVTAVPVLFFFGQASLSGILANFLIVPILGYGAVLTGFTALAFLPMYPPAAVVLLRLAGELVELSNYLIIRLGSLPTLDFYGITKWDMLLFLLVLLFITFGRTTKVTATAFLVLAATAGILHCRPSSFSDGRLHLTMLSVGQGESILVHLPNGRIMLLDGGGFLHENGKDFGERLLAPALLKMGVKKIDVMVMSHSHPDHAGGLPFVAEHFPVGEFLEPVSPGNGAHYRLLKSILAAKGVPVRRLKAGEKLEPSPGVVLNVLSPSLRPVSVVYDDSEENEESLVLHLRYGSATAILTADAGFPAEERIMKSGADISAGLLKVGHHGSRYSTSEAFLNRVAPDFALISAGRENAFGLPASETIKLLERRGIKIFRTDRNGTIVMSTDGSGWSCTSRYSYD